MNAPRNDTPDSNKTLFLHLVMMMASSALQHMGKTVSPLTGKTEIDLDGAAFAIDMLAMIEAKTTGNRDPDEDRILQSQLATLRLNFVETSETAHRDGATATATGNTPAEETPADSPAPDAATAASDQPDPEKPPPTTTDPNTARYHKSYG